MGAPRRYDTRFFLAVAPEEQEALHDNRETIHHLWMSPAEALQRYRERRLKLRTPTIKTLEDFVRYPTLSGLVKEMKSRTDIQAILPRINARGERLLPGDPRYDAPDVIGRRGPWKM